jgi:hypothetical protein
MRLGFICDKARFYTCKGSFNKRVFSRQFFYSNRIISGVDPTQRIPSFNATGLHVLSVLSLLRVDVVDAGSSEGLLGRPHQLVVVAGIVIADGYTIGS